MVPKSSPTYKALTKQGYAIVRTHSGVKICRWTKSALRGRGSCYKFSFYGINSHQCMETTAVAVVLEQVRLLLAPRNQPGRHDVAVGRRPSGPDIRWRQGEPTTRRSRRCAASPGVRAERYAEAMRIRHCALSLVGEPIFYPHINEFLALLHGERISSFLVCNAQHPDQLAALKHVTQLYVSIDASNKDSLRKIDRPLHPRLLGEVPALPGHP